MIIHSYNDHVRLLLPNLRSSMQQSLIAPRQSRHCYEIKWIRPHSLTLADSLGLISPDETDLFRAVAQAVTDGLAVILPERCIVRNIGLVNDSGFIKTILLAGRFLRRAQSSPIATLSSESSATTKNPDRNRILWGPPSEKRTTSPIA